MSTPAPLHPSVQALKTINDINWTMQDAVFYNNPSAWLWIGGGILLLVALGYFWFRAGSNDTRGHFAFGIAGCIAAFGLAFALEVDPLKVMASFDFDDAGDWTRGAEDIGRIISKGAENILMPITLLFSLPVAGYLYLTDPEQLNVSFYDMPPAMASAILACVLLGIAITAWGMRRSRGLRLFICAFLFWSGVLYILLPTLTFLAITSLFFGLILVVFLAMGAGGTAMTRVRRY